ncbi:uncharacterized protein LOC114382317 [Glycine soja]|uniref:uncharacterized protein LOC114382317 n=1 Tax=Glycine soja TaxID=3848 RepID=UPI001039351E|nr:uncharacterized protein LOC114382317 [Glycine soja]
MFIFAGMKGIVGFGWQVQGPIYRTIFSMTELLDMIKCCKSCWLLNTLSSGVAIHFGGSMYLFMVFSLSKLKLCCWWVL